MKQIFLLLCALLSFVLINAQRTISGRVLDQLTHEALQGASVTDRLNTVITDAHGNFEFRTAETFIFITYNSYQSKELNVNNLQHIVVSMLPVSKDLEQVVVSANRTAQKRTDAPVAISTISKQTMEDTKAARLDQLLNKVSGVNMVSLGNEQHEMSIRQPMTTKSLFLYLEDGIPIRTTGLYNHNALLEMNMTGAKQIEVIKGPASSMKLVRDPGSRWRRCNASSISLRRVCRHRNRLGT